MSNTSDLWQLIAGQSASEFNEVSKESLYTATGSIEFEPSSVSIYSFANALSRLCDLQRRAFGISSGISQIRIAGSDAKSAGRMASALLMLQISKQEDSALSENILAALVHQAQQMGTTVGLESCYLTALLAAAGSGNDLSHYARAMNDIGWQQNVSGRQPFALGLDRDKGFIKFLLKDFSKLYSNTDSRRTLSSKGEVYSVSHSQCKGLLKLTLTVAVGIEGWAFGPLGVAALGGLGYNIGDAAGDIVCPEKRGGTGDSAGGDDADKDDSDPGKKPPDENDEEVEGCWLPYPEDFSRDSDKYASFSKAQIKGTTPYGAGLNSLIARSSSGRFSVIGSPGSDFGRGLGELMQLDFRRSGPFSNNERVRNGFRSQMTMAGLVGSTLVADPTKYAQYSGDLYTIETTTRTYSSTSDDGTEEIHQVVEYTIVFPLGSPGAILFGSTIITGERAKELASNEKLLRVLLKLGADVDPGRDLLNERRSRRFV